MDLTSSTWHAIRPSRRSPRHAATRRIDRLEARAWRQSCAGAVVSIGAALMLLAPAHADAAASSTAQLFSNTCAACHAGGGNIVQRNAGLRLDELTRNEAAKPEQIYSLIYSGKGKMPGYGQDCAPKGKCTFAARLTDNQINELTQYVLEQAATGWKS